MASPIERSAVLGTLDAEESGTAPLLPGIGQMTLFAPGEAIELGGDAARYEIVRSLGRGGMAEVFLARRVGPAGLVREVALKCIMAGMEVSERARRAFVYEAQLALRLRHPNIADAYELAELDGRYYLVLEYVDGVTAKAVVQAARREHKRLSEGFCCHVVASVAEGLHYAHGLVGPEGEPLGIVHRDVTASNVMIATSGAVKLLDFGIALARMQGRDKTRTGQLKGTYAYFSPEQAAGKRLDRRSGLFGLGVLLIELLTGERIFDADSDLGTLRKIGHCKPPDVRASTRGLPRDLSAICEKALARRPADRFQDGAEFSKALQEYLAKRGATYWPSDCAAELRGLRVLETGSEGTQARDAEGRSATLTNDATISAGPLSREGGRVRRRAGRAWMIAAGVVAAVLLAVLGVALRPLGSSGDVAASPAFRTTPPSVAEHRPSDEAKVEAAALKTVGAAPAMPLVDESIVRPKKSASKETRSRTRRGAPVATRDRGDRSAPRGGVAEFADRPTVASASATLARGTLVPVKLVRPIDLTRPGEAQAVVTEEVASEGVTVPKGSTVACTSRPSKDGRVPLSCDAIKTPDGLLYFKGVAVGEGQHVGLRVLDNEVAGGTSFVVYVSASAAVR